MREVILRAVKIARDQSQALEWCCAIGGIEILRRRMQLFGHTTLDIVALKFFIPRVQKMHLLGCKMAQMAKLHPQTPQKMRVFEHMQEAKITGFLCVTCVRK